MNHMSEDLSDATVRPFYADVNVLRGTDRTPGRLPSTGLIGLYFSAHWCPPCRAFTPQLAAFSAFAAAHSADPANGCVPIEFVFVSSDHDETSFEEYWATMGFPAVQYTPSGEEEACHRQLLASGYNIDGYPTLLIVEAATGRIIDAKGRGTVQGGFRPNDPDTGIKILQEWSAII